MEGGETRGRLEDGRDDGDERRRRDEIWREEERVEHAMID